MPSDHAEPHAWGVELRSLRAQRPGLARLGARAHTFGASLEQAEQLWRASEAVSPIASPLLLFYGLTQAGRAICASGPGSAWRPAENHGLAFEITLPTSGANLDLTKVMVKPSGVGLVQRVAHILDSPVLEAPATLSALLASIDAELLFTELQVPDLRPVGVSEWTKNLTPIATSATQSLFLAPAPDRFAANTELVPAGPQNLEYTRIIPPSADAIAGWLSAYPTLRDLGVPTEVIGPEPSLDRSARGDWIIKLIWDSGTPKAGVEQNDWTADHLDEVYAYSWSGTSGVVLPAVGGNTKAHDLLITWWLVLYCLSMLARYYPKEWTELLDVDKSQLAVPIEHVLSVAYSKVPTLLAFRLRLLRSIQERPSTQGHQP
jgi:hypothetical protein